MPISTTSRVPRGLSGADLIVAEVDDHLYEKADSLLRVGMTLDAAEREAVNGFGSADCVARAHRTEAKRRRAAVPTRRTRAAGIVMFVAPVLALVGQTINLTVKKGAVHGLVTVHRRAVHVGRGVRVRRGHARRRGVARRWHVAHAHIMPAAPVVLLGAGAVASLENDP